jgi:hypothetical protein
MFDDIALIKNTFRPVKNNHGNLIFHGEYKDLKMDYYNDFHVLSITSNASKLINKSTISTEDHEAVIKEYKNQFNEVGFKYTDPLQKLNRIDYKTDIITEHKNLYIKLLKKSINTYGALKQNNIFDSSIYYNSKALNINIYDKEQEQRDKLQIVDDRYTNVIRFEAQLKRDRLNYIQNKDGLCKELSNYFHIKDHDYFINKELQKIIYNGNYYNLYHSSRRLKEHYSKNMTDKLIQLQKSISIYGITKVKANYSVETFRVYLKLLQDAEVNPIPIPKNEAITSLANPFKFTQNNIYLLNNYKLQVA